MATTAAATPATTTQQRRPQSLASACSLQQASPRTGSFVGSRASTPLDTRAADNDEWATLANSATHVSDSEFSSDRRSVDSDDSESSSDSEDGEEETNNYGSRPRGGRRSKKHHGLETESVGARSAAYEQSTVLSAPTVVSGTENHNDNDNDDNSNADDDDDNDNDGQVDDGDGDGDDDDDEPPQRSRARRVDEGSRARLDKSNQEQNMKRLSEALHTAEGVDEHAVRATLQVMRDIATPMDNLTWLELTAAPVKSHAVCTLAAALATNESLIGVGLAQCNIGNSAAVALAVALRTNAKLHTLSLSDNRIGDRGAIELARALEMNNTLHSIFLQNNRVGDDGARRLARALRKANDALHVMSFGGNRVTNEGGRALARALRHNNSLWFFDVKGNRITDAEIDSQIRAESARVCAQHVKNVNGIASLIVTWPVRPESMKHARRLADQLRTCGNLASASLLCRELRALCDRVPSDANVLNGAVGILGDVRQQLLPFLQPRVVLELDAAKEHIRSLIERPHASPLDDTQSESNLRLTHQVKELLGRTFEPEPYELMRETVMRDGWVSGRRWYHQQRTLLPNEPEYARVMYALARGGVLDYGKRVCSVTAIDNPDLRSQFRRALEQLEVRSDMPKFNDPWEQFVDEREHATARACLARMRRCQLKASGTDGRVRLFWMFHGCRTVEAANSIADSGFEQLQTTDAGYFGSGIYVTPQADYAARVYGRAEDADDNCACVVLSCAITLNVLPVLRSAQVARAARLAGADADVGADAVRADVLATLPATIDSHWVCVVPRSAEQHVSGCEVEFDALDAGADVDSAAYDELVVRKSHQLLPMFVIRLAADGDVT